MSLAASLPGNKEGIQPTLELKSIVRSACRARFPPPLLSTPWFSSSTVPDSWMRLQDPSSPAHAITWLLWFHRTQFTPPAWGSDSNASPIAGEVHTLTLSALVKSREEDEEGNDDDAMVPIPRGGAAA